MSAQNIVRHLRSISCRYLFRVIIALLDLLV